MKAESIVLVVAYGLVAAILTLSAPASGQSADDTPTPVAINVGLAATAGLRFVALDGGRIAFQVSEADEGGTDRNGDGDATDLVAHVWDPATNATTNLGLATASANIIALHGGRLALHVSEFSQGGMDRNGDGDAHDQVMHVWDPATGETINLALAARFEFAALDGGLLAFLVVESTQGTDRNGDGDKGDFVMAIWNPATNIVTNLGLANSSAGPLALEGGLVAFHVTEGPQAADLNADGDRNDAVMHVWDPSSATTNLGLANNGSNYVALRGGGLGFTVSESAQGGADLNADGDAFDRVAHVWNPQSNITTNLGFATELSVALDGGRLALAVPEGGLGRADLNGDGDVHDAVVHVWDPGTGLATNLALASFPVGALAGGKLAFVVPEASQGITDLNGDGDAGDLILHVWDAAAATTTNLGLATTGVIRPLDGGGAAVVVQEQNQGVTDLNGDGDADDVVVHVWNPATNTTANLGFAAPDTAGVSLRHGRFVFHVLESSQGVTDLNGDGDADDEIIHIWDPGTNATTNLGLSSLHGSFHLVALDNGGFASLLFEGSEGVDLNGDGDATDSVPHVVRYLHADPIVSATRATPHPVPVGVGTALAAVIDDSVTGGSAIAAAHYSLDGGPLRSMAAVDGAFDETSEEVHSAIPAFGTTGVHQVCVFGTDASGSTGAPECILIAVYDPSAGRTSGAGWIDSPSGAYTPENSADGDVTGKAHFTFLCRYQNGASIPEGQTHFRFPAASLDFESTTYDWLVVSGGRAQFKGSGRINRTGSYDFLLTAIDGDQGVERGPDRFRIKIWDPATGAIIYDNSSFARDTSRAGTPPGGGAIIIQH